MISAVVMIGGRGPMLKIKTSDPVEIGTRFGDYVVTSQNESGDFVATYDPEA